MAKEQLPPLAVPIASLRYPTAHATISMRLTTFAPTAAMWQTASHLFKSYDE
jgi:hypothetical protein